TRNRLLKSLALGALSSAALLAVGRLLPQFDPILPILTLSIGACVQTLQHAGMRYLWFLAVVLPMALASLFSGSFISAENESSFFIAFLIRSIGLTAACVALTWLSRIHQSRRQQ